MVSPPHRHGSDINHGLINVGGAMGDLHRRSIYLTIRHHHVGPFTSHVFLALISNPPSLCRDTYMGLRSTPLF